LTSYDHLAQKGTWARKWSFSATTLLGLAVFSFATISQKRHLLFSWKYLLLDWRRLSIKGGVKG